MIHRVLSEKMRSLAGKMSVVSLKGPGNPVKRCWCGAYFYRGIPDEKWFAKKIKPFFIGITDSQCFAKTEIRKALAIEYIQPQCYYWRDNTGNEIDLLMEEGGKLIPVEIISGRTIQPDFYRIFAKGEPK